MSRIIKAEKDTDVPVSAFDFAEIEEGAEEEVRPPSECDVAEKCREDAPPAPDPAEIEAIIHRKLLEAERKSQEMEKEGYLRGYAQGEKDGIEYGKKRMMIVKDRLEEIIENVQRLSDRVLQDYRDWMISTCLAVARRIVRRELAMDTGYLVDMIDALLAEADEKNTVTIYLNANDLRLLEEHLDLRELTERSAHRCRLKADESIEQGGCRLESEIQLLDASIEKQFAQIEQNLRAHASE